MSNEIIRFTQEACENSFLDTLQQFATALEDTSCDKCDSRVPSGNSVAVYEFINTSGHWISLLNNNRHLQPVADEKGIVVCEGSPSRWQDVSGVPDERVEYRRGKKRDSIPTAIWELMQEVFGEKESDKA